jgi:O-antigen ligase
MTALLYVTVGALALLGMVLSIPRPARTVLPAYAATLPMASVVKLSVPFPAPFNTLSSLVGGVVVVACVLHLVIHQRGRVPTLPVGAWLMLLAWSTLTVLWAIDTSTAVTTVEVAASLILLMTLVSVVRVDGVDLDVLRLAIIASGIIVGGYAMFLLLKGAPLPTHGASQRFSLATNPSDTDPNILAASLLVPLLLSVERILMGGSRWFRPATWRMIGMAGAFFATLAIVITGSRGGLVAGVLGFLIVMVSCYRLPAARQMVRRVVTTIMALAFAFVVIGATGTAVSPGGTADRVFSSDALQRIFAVQNSSSGRFQIWEAGFLACEAHCGVGAGLGNFPDAYNQVFAFSGASKDPGANRPAHNIYLEMAVDTGFVGLTLLILVLIAEWRAVSRRRMRELVPSLKGIMVALLVANFFLSAIWFKYFFLVFVLVRMAEGAAERPDPARWAARLTEASQPGDPVLSPSVHQ